MSRRSLYPAGTRISITLGPDDVNGGICYQVAYRGADGDLSEGSSGGWGGNGPRNPDAWLALAKRRIGLPEGVTRWEGATVEPDGYSQGKGHAPQGICITWEIT